MMAVTSGAPSSSVNRPGRFPSGGRRLVVYVIWDRRGDVEDYIPVALEGLREHAAHLLVVVNGALSDAGRAKLTPIADEILVRDNVGFDIWAHKDALEHLGETISEYDELVMTNDTWFGPIRPYGPVFERMGESEVHFWGMTDHAREVPNPFTKKGVLPYHLQSFWIAVRRGMFLSEDWTRYWSELPAMPSYFDAVLKHEAVFTERFTDRGYVVAAAFPSAGYPTDHPALFNPDLLLADGCPVLKRRPLFHYPPFLDRHAVIGRQVLQRVEAYGFPLEVIWQDLARNVQPKVLNADAGMLEVLPEVDVSYDSGRPFRIAAVAHVPDARRLGSLLRRLAVIPVPFDLIVTTPHADQRKPLREAIAALGAPQIRSSEVRVVPSGLGRGDMSAFFIGCRDILRGDSYDLVVKVHSRTPSKRSANHRRYFRRYQLENLLSSNGYVANVLALFQREPGLGVVFPPMIHIGYKTAGTGWIPYRESAIQLCEELGIGVPLDGISPLAPLGGMWIARPEALKLLADVDWEYSQYTESTRKKRTDLARLQERLISSAAGERGYHTRTIMNAEHAALSHLSLEYKIDQISATLPGYPVDQIQFLHRAGWAGHGGIVAIVRMYMNINHPETMRAIAPVTRPLGKVARRGIFALRSAKRRLRDLRGGAAA